MSELRQNLATKEWVIIAPERGQKPNEFEKGIKSNPAPENEYEDNCPFCPGNEEKYEILEYDRIGGDSWKLKVIENKYKVLGKFNTCPIAPDSFRKEGIYFKTVGCGSHYILIESNKHSRTIVDMGIKEIKDILSIYLKYYQEMSGNPNNLLPLIFKNYGLLAGQTQPHTHSQIVGSRIVPLHMRSLLHESEKHFDNQGACVFCDILKYELNEKKRIILENDDFAAFIPFAAAVQHEVWLTPKKHSASLSILQDEKVMNNFSNIFRLILGKYKEAVDNPNFNYVFRLPPYPLSGVPFFHWYVQFLPRTKIIGGFERGSMISVNTITPEDSAKILRGCGDKACSI